MVRRRTVIKAAGSMAIVSSLAGCSGGSDSDSGGSDRGDSGSSAETVIDETVFQSEDGIFRFEAESGQTISVSASNEQGRITIIRLYDPEDELVHEEEVETESEFTHGVTTGGAWMIQVATFGEATVEVAVG